MGKYINTNYVASFSLSTTALHYLFCIHSFWRNRSINTLIVFHFSNVEQRIMLTGDHWVRDVHCKKCQNKLGWMYEFATEDTQRYKEARTILEKALVMEKDGIEDHVTMDH